LGQVKVAKKANEIAAIPELLELLMPTSKAGQPKHW
jgi:predicted transposase YbfD/YdcC